jgi:hypothetical protein
MRLCAFVLGILENRPTRNVEIIDWPQGSETTDNLEKSLDSCPRLAAPCRSIKSLAFRSRYVSQVSVASDELPLSQAHPRDQHDHPFRPSIFARCTFHTHILHREALASQCMNPLSTSSPQLAIFILASVGFKP